MYSMSVTGTAGTQCSMQCMVKRGQWWALHALTALSCMYPAGVMHCKCKKVKDLPCPYSIDDKQAECVVNGEG